MKRWLCLIGVVGALLASTNRAPAAWPPEDADSAPAATLTAGLLDEVREIAQHDADPARRGWAWRALAAAHDPAIKELYQQGLNDPSAFVRAEVITSLTGLAGQSSDEARAMRQAIARALSDPSPIVRERTNNVFRASASADWTGLGIEAAPVDVTSFSVVPLWEARGRSDEIWRTTLAAAGRLEGMQRRLMMALIYTPESEAPPEWKERAVAAGLASNDVELQVDALEAASPDLVELVARCLAHSDARVRVAGFNRTGTIGDEAKFEELLNQALRDASPKVVQAAIKSARKHALNIDVDRDEFRRQCERDDFAQVDAAIMVLLKAETQQLGGPERVEFLDRLRTQLTDPTHAGVDRRVTVGLLSRVVLDHYGDGQLRGNTARRNGTTRGFLSLERAIPQMAKVLAALIPAAADADPYVRFAVCRALASGASPALADGKFTEAQAADAWRAILPLASDENREVQRALALRLQYIDESLQQDETLRSSAEAAALKLLWHPNKLAARGAARYFVRRGWRPEAAPVLIAELQDRPESLTERDLSLRRAAMQELLENAPESVTTEMLLDCASDEVIFIQSTGRVGGSVLTNTEKLAVNRLLDSNSVGLLLKRVEEAEFGRDEHLAYRMLAGDHWDAADVSEVFAFLDRLAPERVQLMETLVKCLERLPTDLTRERLTALALAAGTRPATRCVIVNHEPTPATLPAPAPVLTTPTLAALLASPDPLVCLLAMQKLTLRAEPIAASDGPQYAKTLAREAVRRRTER